MYGMGRERQVSEGYCEGDFSRKNTENSSTEPMKVASLKHCPSVLVRSTWEARDRLWLICLSNEEIIDELTYSTFRMSGNWIIVDWRVYGKLGHGSSNLF